MDRLVLNLISRRAGEVNLSSERIDAKQFSRRLVQRARARRPKYRSALGRCMTGRCVVLSSHELVRHAQAHGCCSIHLHVRHCLGHVLDHRSRASSGQSSNVHRWCLEAVQLHLQSGEVTNVFGERPVGYLIYTKAGRIFAFLVGSDRKAPNNAEPTDSERAELFKSMVGYTGTYKSKAARSSLEQMRLGFNRGQELIGRRWRKWSVTASRSVPL